MNLIDNIEREETIREAAYAGNIGFEEMVLFYQKANPSQIKKMESMIKRKSWKGVKELFKNILGIELK